MFLGILNYAIENQKDTICVGYKEYDSVPFRDLEELYDSQQILVNHSDCKNVNFKIRKDDYGWYLEGYADCRLNSYMKEKRDWQRRNCDYIIKK